MSLRIRTQATEASGGETVDTYLDRIVKYIPAQVVSFYTAAIVWLSGGNMAARGAGTTTAANTNAAANTSTAAAGAGNADWPLWAVFALGLLLTGLFMKKQTDEPGKPTAIKQVIIACVSFIVWAFATGGPFSRTLGDNWQPAYAAILLAAYVLVIGLYIPKED